MRSLLCSSRLHLQCRLVPDSPRSSFCSGGVGHYRLGEALLAAEGSVQNRPLWFGNLRPSGVSSHPRLAQWRWHYSVHTQLLLNIKGFDCFFLLQVCFMPLTRIGTITSTLRRSRVDCRPAAGAPSLRGRNVSSCVTSRSVPETYHCLKSVV